MFIVCTENSYSSYIEHIEADRAKRPMTTAYRLETALHCLNTLIDEQGYEFPEAVAKTIESFAVNRKALIALYDAQ